MQRAHPLAHLVDVDVADDVGLPVRREQAIDEQLQPVGLLDDHLRVFGERARLDLHLEQLRGAADAAERVLDLVGEVPDQLLGRLGLLERALLALLAVLLLDLDDLEDDVPRAVDLVDRDVHGQQLAPRDASGTSRAGWSRRRCC